MNSYIHNARFDKQFTVTYNLTPEDPRMTWASKGILWYILTRPDNWKVYTKQLASVYQGDVKKGNGQTAVDSAMKELRELGYVVYQKTRNEKGQWDHIYHVYPMPVTEFQKKFPEAVIPGLDNPPQDNPPQGKRRIITSTDRPNTDDNKNLREEKGGEPPKTPRAPHVSTSDDEHKRLADEYGERLREQAYQVLSEWKEDTPRSKWKKSDYRSIKRWVMKSIQENRKKNGKSRANSNLPEDIKDQYDGRW